MNFADRTWEEIRALDKTRVVAILPVGAIEAHGPHLPLATDVIIAEAMARAAAERLKNHSMETLILPTLSYSVAHYAAGFPGTLCIRPETTTSLILDIARSLAAQGMRLLAIANAHLEPAHIASLKTAVDAIHREKLLTLVFPDITQKPWALRLTDEFKSGACHAGQYEGSVVLAARPDLVKESIRKMLPPNPTSLAKAIREGKTTFEEAGGAQAYFGNPAAATVEEGRQTIEILGHILEEAILGASTE